MIAFLTDFGPGLYTGMMRAAVLRDAPAVPVVDLVSDLPAFNVPAAARMVAALASQTPVDSVLVCVVDPGVGSAEREPWLVRADGRWFVGPGNGLFDVVCAHGPVEEAAVIDWRPDRLSATFHGRDLFAPVAARIATARDVPRHPAPRTWPDRVARLAEVIYVDAYGNAMTGLDMPSTDAKLRVGDHTLEHAETFAAVPAGTGFWHRNSIGLVEISVNRGSAARTYGLAVGNPVEFTV